MQISVKGKQLDVGENLRAHVEATLQDLVGKYFQSALEAHVTLAKDAHLYRAEVTVHPTRGTIVQASANANEPYPAFDEAARTMGKRLQRYRSRLQDRHGPSHEAVAADLSARSAVLDTTPNEAAQTHESMVVAELTTPIHFLTVSEAVMKLELEDLPALLFTNKAHGGLNMVYRRNDGNVGWVDPAPVTKSK
ncbi:MAG: ribosome-associated translation inhibitor RaiA [Bdellovibrionales bacterium]